MWTFNAEPLNEGNTLRFQLFENGMKLSYPQVIDYWINNPAFCTFYNSILAESAFPAFFWECKPIKEGWEKQTFEFVLVNSSSLLRIEPEREYFEEYFYTEESVVTFPNLRGDALLVVPTPVAKESCYSHMAAFVRKAPAEQQIELWKIVGQQFNLRLHSKPFWLSTAGLGVYWLHIRLDSRPKYYRHGPYKN